MSEAYPVVMPRLGLTMTEAQITEWLANEGDWVRKGQPLFVLEHEKASLEIESPESGYLHIRVPVGKTVPILTPVAELAPKPGEPPEARDEPERETTRPLLIDSPIPALSGEGTANDTAAVIRATPKARALARKEGVSLLGIAGSGPRSMITTIDVEAALRVRRSGARVSPVAARVARDLGVNLDGLKGSGPHGQVMRRDVERVSSVRQPEAAGIHVLGGLRGVIARRLSESWLERPQVTLTTEADASSLVALREQMQAEWKIKVSYNALLMKLTAKALKEFPYMNARLGPDGIQLLEPVHIGVAVDTDRGLLVPVVRDADKKEVRHVHQELAGLAERALSGGLRPDELTGGTFTITNLGVYEIDAFTPLINPPECAILGIGRIVAKPVGVNGQIVLREMMALSLSFDHRLVDGAPAARFLQRIKALIERSFLIGFEP